MGNWFEAKRPGKCAHCGTPFEAGTEVYAKSAGVYYCQACGNLAEATAPAAGQLETAVMQELARLPMEAGTGLLAQTMLSLARDLDAGDVPPRERPQYTKELRIGLLTLQDAFPAQEEDDETAEAQRKRERRAREAGGF